MTVDSYRVLVRAMVLSWLNNCNGLLVQLSSIMRAAAWLVQVLPRQSHPTTTDIRTRLRWPDIFSRVHNKLCFLAYGCLHDSASLSRQIFQTAQSRGVPIFFRCQPTMCSSLAVWRSLLVDLCDPRWIFNTVTSFESHHCNRQNTWTACNELECSPLCNFLIIFEQLNRLN